MNNLKTTLLPGIFLNPKLPQATQGLLTQAYKGHSLANHIYICSSGTESSSLDKIKLVGISLHAMKVAAKSVADRFGISSTDRWLLALPNFHVGGQAVLARAAVSGMHIFESTYNRWDVSQFCSDLSKHQITLTSLVPTQVYDLVVNKTKPPKSLRVLMVGGGAMSKTLRESALALGWPLVLTYGMTETSAMMATTNLLNTEDDAGMSFLPHVQYEVGVSNKTKIFSSALFSHYLLVGPEEVQVEGPFVNGWFELDDNLDINSNGKLTVHGRKSELVKIKGESVSLASVRDSFEKVLLMENIKTDFHILAVEHARDGNKLFILSTDMRDEKLVSDYNVSAMKYSQLEYKYVDEIPRTAIGKVQDSVLREKYFRD